MLEVFEAHHGIISYLVMQRQDRRTAEHLYALQRVKRDD